MRTKSFFNYRILIWVLFILAIVMGGVSLVIAFTYRLQKETERNITQSRNSVSEAKEMENELTAIKGLTYTYRVNKSKVWLDSLNTRQSRFVIHLERARLRVNSDEDRELINQISALFANYQQTIQLSVNLIKKGETDRANALLAHSVQDLLLTIQQKSNQFIEINRQAEYVYELEWSKTNNIILRILIGLGIGGITSGLVLGWLIFRMLFRPINQLVLRIRNASGEDLLENFDVQLGSEVEELEERVKDLIMRINRANQEINKKQELLQHSNKFANLGKIAPTIAHEIRNPLASIKMLVYSIREEVNLSSSIREDLDIITKEIDRMEKFTKDFLRFAKPADPVFAIVNPLVGLSEVVQLLKPRIRKNNIQLMTPYDEVNATIYADQGQCKQIYMNIILNAIEVMPSGGTLTIGSELTTKNETGSNNVQEFLVIWFSDTGPGVPDAIMKTLFEPFIKTSDQGVGIGLSISQEIARLHKGWIEVENNTLSSGATFKLFLPLHIKGRNNA